MPMDVVGVLAVCVARRLAQINVSAIAKRSTVSAPSDSRFETR